MKSDLFSKHIDDGSYWFPDRQVINCPACGNNCIHHDYVIINNTESSIFIDPVRLVTRTIEKLSDENQIVQIVIGFCCEECDANIEVDVMQHKGKSGISVLWDEKGRRVEKIKNRM